MQDTKRGHMAQAEQPVEEHQAIVLFREKPSPWLLNESPTKWVSFGKGRASPRNWAFRPRKSKCSAP